MQGGGMHLYHLTLQRASTITAAIYGNFSAPKVQEVVAARGGALELLRPDDAGRLQTIAATEAFGVIRSLAPFRLPGGATDYVVVGSDSGRLVILRFDAAANAFAKVHQETFGRSGVRRAVPGEYVAVDPKGRAVCVAALERAKFVYVLNRDAEARLTISSPLEAHKSRHIVYDLVGLDVGFDNPQFAAIELDYGEADADPTGAAAAAAEKLLVVYELDLGLNTVVRKHAEPVDPGANRLLAVPGPADGGPGGVLVCCENFVLYRNPGAGAAAPPELRAVIPRRADLPPERGVLLTAAAVLRQKARFYAFAQSEYGDVYRISLQHAGEAVSELKVRYFDTVPPAAALCVLRRGFLFAAAEFGDHALYQFTGLGDGEAVEASSATLERVGGGAGGGGGEDGEEAGYAPVFFEPRFPPANLEAVDRLESLAPVTALAVANLLGEEAPQVYAACGRGARSTLRCLRPGLAVAELAASALPGAATGVWTLRARLEDAHDALIVVSFAEATLVLGVGETVEAVADSGLAAGVRTLAAARLADASLLQVHPGGLRHVRPDGRVSEWRAPGRRAVTAAAANARQVAVALAGGELVYFELSAQGMLVEAERREAGGDVAALDVAPLEEGRARARVLAVAGFDSALRLLSLDPGEGLRPLATQALAANAESVLLLDAPDGGLLLQAGLANGVLVRAEVDRVTGQLAGTRTRFLGVRAPLLARVAARGAPAALALSSRPWLAYAEGGRLAQAPLSHGPLDFAAPFASEQCPEGFVAVAGATLRVLAVERLGGGAFNAASLRLRYTPRALAVHPDARVLLVAEADAGAVSLAGRAALAAAAAAAGGGAMELAAPPPPAPDAPGPEGDADASARDDALGAPRAAAPGAWASCLRVVDPATFATTQTLELDGDEAALSLAVATFESAPEAGALVCVGVARALRFGPRADAGGAVRVYRLAPDGRALELLHSTEVGGVPRALCAFRGMLLVGVGDAVRLYALGKKRLLRKCEARGLPSEAATLHASGPRVYVGDARESFFFMKYKKSENKLYVFADDAAPRHVLAAANLDYDSMAGGDRFGNLFVCRLPPELSAAAEEDPTAGKYAGAGAGPAPARLAAAAHFHVGAPVTALARAALAPGGREALLYATVHGAIGALYPLASKEDAEFCQFLEMHMRQEAPPLLGRDHLAFRSAHAPARAVADGDLCAQFGALTAERRRAVAAELDRTPAEVLRKLEDLAGRIL